MKFMEEKTIKLAIVALSAVLVILLVLLAPFVMAYLNINPGSSNIQGPKDVADRCNASNSSLSKASSCAVDKTLGFYKYNIDNAGKNLTFSELKDEGGVCSSWSKYYSQIGSEMGFNTTEVVIPVSNSFYHEFSVWSDSKGYCIIDQTQAKCFNFSVE